ncbi:MAG: hypothetical protein II736_00930 [Clostridia bacterium]|nr:hypothetical protein [Clostridia bacterium]
MRKITAILLGAVLLASLMAVTSFGSAYRGSDLDHNLTAKKADPADVVKDGIIGENEYVEFELGRDEDTTPINVIYYAADVFQSSLDMMKTTRFYFSWDDVHGFNFAIRYKPTKFFQVQSEGETDPPKDYFLINDGVAINFDTEQMATGGSQPLLYYTIAKRTDTGEYLRGYYGTEQLGLHAYYNPIPGEDFVIVYDDATGFITVEWSIPLDNLFTTWGEGTRVHFSIAAIAGEREEPDEYNPIIGAYASALGYKSWGCDDRQGGDHAEVVLSEEPIKDSGGDVPTSDTSTGEPVPTETDEHGEPVPAPTETDVNGEPIPTQTETDVNGDPVPVDTNGNGGGNGGNGGTAPRTGDPMIIIAAVSALGACGAFVIKRRRG